MRVLKIISSIHGEAAASTQLAADIAARVGTGIVTRDLASASLPHLDEMTFAAFNTPADERSAEQSAAVALSDELIEEIRVADTLVIGVPMYNFGIPSTLKAWIDNIARAGVSFRYTSAGPEGLLGEKRIIVVATRGGQYAGSDADTQSAYIRQVFGFLGLGEPEFVYAEGLANPERREQVITELRESLLALAA